jgi:hypothetical protein
VAIEHGGTVPGDTRGYEGTESTQVGQVRFLTKVCFMWGAPNGTVPQPILQVNGVEQCVGPKTGWEARGVEKTPYHDAEGLFQAFNSAILRRSVGAGGFDDKAVFGDDLAELRGTGEFDILVHANRAGPCSCPGGRVWSETRQGWRPCLVRNTSKMLTDGSFEVVRKHRGGEEAPGIAAAGIRDEAVRIVSVVR